MGSGIIVICFSDGVYFSYLTNYLDEMNDTFLVNFLRHSRDDVMSECMVVEHTTIIT